VGGCNVADVTSRVMFRLMSNDVAKSLNWAGIKAWKSEGDAKRGFGGTVLAQVIGEKNQAKFITLAAYFQLNIQFLQELFT